MPFKSEKQRKYMHAKHPEMAKRWEKEGKMAGYKKSSVGKAVAKATGGRASAPVKKMAAKKAASYVRSKKGK